MTNSIAKLKIVHKWNESVLMLGDELVASGNAKFVGHIKDAIACGYTIGTNDAIQEFKKQLQGRADNAYTDGVRAGVSDTLDALTNVMELSGYSSDEISELLELIKAELSINKQ